MQPFEEGCRLAAGIPGARFVALEGRNHLVLEKRPGLERGGTGVTGVSRCGARSPHWRADFQHVNAGEALTRRDWPAPVCVNASQQAGISALGTSDCVTRGINPESVS